MQRFACGVWLWYEGHVDVVSFYDKNIMLLTTLTWGLEKTCRDDESHMLWRSGSLSNVCSFPWNLSQALYVIFWWEYGK